MSADANFEKYKDLCPTPPKPAGVYKGVVVVNNLAYVSGHGPLKADGTWFTGKVGKDLDVEAGRVAAKQCALALLTTLKANIGSLDKVKRVIKTLGMVNGTPEFTQHVTVINGFSETLAEIFGPEKGVGARSAVGMGSLPNNISVEVEVIFEI